MTPGFGRCGITTGGDTSKGTRPMEVTTPGSWLIAKAWEVAPGDEYKP
jgi:hypothetical protein